MPRVTCGTFPLMVGFGCAVWLSLAGAAVYRVTELSYRRVPPAVTDCNDQLTPTVSPAGSSCLVAGCGVFRRGPCQRQTQLLVHRVPPSRRLLVPSGSGCCAANISGCVLRTHTLHRDGMMGWDPKSALSHHRKCRSPLTSDAVPPGLPAPPPRARGWDYDVVGVARVQLRQVLEDLELGAGGGLRGSGLCLTSGLAATMHQHR